MHQTNKFWAKNDEILLADIKSEEAPPDPFKTIHEQLKKKNLVAQKVTKISHYTANENVMGEPQTGTKSHNHRWTTIEN